MKNTTFWRRVSNLTLLSTIIILLSGCSLLPRLTFDRPNTVPQTTEKSERHIYHKTKDGEIFKLDEKNYVQKERKLTFQERIVNFIANLKGWFFWIFLALLLFCPTAIGGIIGWFINSVTSVYKKALNSTVTAIQIAKNTDGDYLKALSVEHNKSPKVKKVVNNLRAKISPNVPYSSSIHPASSSAAVVPSDIPPPHSQ